ncbi:GDSL-type esterase/lipase family protein [Chitinibacter sp. GC72]|uniref:GDSL-type esterase/lipase family protein n=1 Tax=Chitinibacter sp. GC72 TaxID=1526917 RepID=UPI0012FC6248|nr:GDSL-type esterase/lipase family protein [Chitinibacter sp. GC72]
MLRWFLFSCCLLWLTACGKTPELAPLPVGSVVLAFGDSLTYGTGTTEEQAYPARLAAKTGWEIVNAGVPGETAAQARTRFVSTLDETKPKLVLLCLGGNDFLQKLDAAQTKYELGLMIEELQRRKIALLLIGVPKLGLGLGSAPLYAELAEQYGVALNDEILETILAKSSLKSDAVHPNAAGYAMMADKLAEQLAELGAWRR